MKKILKISIITFIFVVILGIVYCADNNLCMAKKKVKVKIINMKKGEKYKLKLKSCEKIKCNNKKIVRATKKGKVTALKDGKCIIKVYKGKKLKMKYKITVKTPTNEPNVTPSPTDGPTETSHITGVPMMVINNLNVDRIMENENGTSSLIYLKINENTIYVNKSLCQYIVVELQNDEIIKEGLVVGDDVWLFFNMVLGFEQKYENNLCFITSDKLAVHKD